MGNNHQLHLEWPKARRRAHSGSLIGGYHYYHLSQHINNFRVEEFELGDIDVRCQGQHFWVIFGKGGPASNTLNLSGIILLYQFDSVSIKLLFNMEWSQLQ